jgi:uncharacterized protein
MHDTRERLGQALRDALKARDTMAVSALRSALSAIANAEAVETGAGARASSPYVAGAASGIGSGDVPRRALTDADVDRIVQTEISERLQAADGYDRAGRAELAERLRSEAGILTGQLPRG